ncbi:hypothetical protein IWW37_005969 [Coemansia sp. RSA 2050]|nr:hypothetical protein IWW37_005969 [Coemansia sp. RSA 2050]KAJ2728484.1 hypothetical protein IW152_005958 [Coemansia sp. BCRC 34962]
MPDSGRDSQSPTLSGGYPKPARTGRGAKPHVPSACTNCKKAHLACDLQRPCRRCVGAGKCDTCQDVQHKKRGRPRSKDKKPTAPMQTHMFQFSLPTNAWRLPDCAAPVATSHLFLTPDLRCLRLEESSGRLLLGYSLLSLINRSVLDFVSDCDHHTVLAAFAAVRKQLSMRLGPAHEHALAQPPSAIDPNAFQTQPVDRLLQRAPVDAYSDVRAHLRTASGTHCLFNIHIYAATCAALAMADIYYVCRITRLDTSCPTPPMLPGCPVPEPMADLGHPYQRKYASPPRRAPDALYMLAAVTDTDSQSTPSLASSWSSKMSTVSSSPTLSASVPRSTALPSLSELLKSLGTDPGPRIWSPTLDSAHCTSP